jgi:hypothetical protein
MNEIAKGLWDLSVQWLKFADDCDDINNMIAYTGMAECALKQAQFALDHPELVMGLDQVPMPPGAMPGQQVPLGPTQGPRVWGAPSS